tara:strand:+ start:266 stop:706 length:441 start_codon:yes stop_codon:yes gene_type:complete
VAIVDKNTNNWFNVDRDEDVFIGIQLPFVMGNGQEASTKTTLEAVKQNVLNLLNTEMGERVMQPNLGVRLKKFLFEPFNQDVVDQVKNVIFESMNYWLPFCVVNNIEVKMSEIESGDFRSTMNISVNFSLKKDPSTNESITIDIGT